MRPAIQDVAGLHQLRPAPGPLPPAIDHASVLQHAHELVKAAVHVADRHHS